MRTQAEIPRLNSVPLSATCRKFVRSSDERVGLLTRCTVHFDKNENGCIELTEPLAILDLPDVNPNLDSSFSRADSPGRCAALRPVQRALSFVFWGANTLTMQTLLYVAFVATTSIFLTGCLRSSYEYYLDKAMNDILFNNVFDTALNKFDNVRAS